VEDVRARAAADEGTVGVLLIGSRATGSMLPGSDYDLLWIVSDGELAARDARGEQRQVKQGDVDAQYLNIGRVKERAHEFDWATSALLTSQIVVDKTGEVAATIEEMRQRAGERARTDVPVAYDSYLNSYVRSLKAWRRDNEIGGRMHATESMSTLVRTLFGVAGEWPPYHDELERHLGPVEEQLGLAVSADVETIVCTGHPLAQQELETRIEAFMTRRGILHDWEDALDKLRDWRF
jgi:hypothetical protein